MQSPGWYHNLALPNLEDSPSWGTGVWKLVAVGLLLSISCLGAALHATPPSLSAVRIERPPVLDGRVNDEEWGAAPTASDFVQQRPAL